MINAPLKRQNLAGTIGFVVKEPTEVERPTEENARLRADAERLRELRGLAANPTTNPIDTVRYWRDAYSNPTSGPHFQGHGVLVRMLDEYLALRIALIDECRAKDEQ